MGFNAFAIVCEVASNGANYVPRRGPMTHKLLRRRSTPIDTGTPCGRSDEGISYIKLTKLAVRIVPSLR